MIDALRALASISWRRRCSAAFMISASVFASFSSSLGLRSPRDPERHAPSRSDGWRWDSPPVALVYSPWQSLGAISTRR